MEQVKNIEEEQYCVYGHFYKNVIFYIGSGAYDRDNILRSRAYDFRKGQRNENWFNYCEGNTDQIKVRIFLRTNNRREAYDFEEELTQHYFDHEAPLVNKNIGTHFSAESRKKMSLVRKGIKLSAETRNKISKVNKGKKLSAETRNKISKNSGRAKKVLVIDNKSGESKILDSITKTHKFISENGFDKAQNTLQGYLNKGPYNFGNYTMELTK